jgi:hypothetical protein
MDASGSGAGSSGTARNTSSTAGNSGNTGNPDDPMDVVYKAIVENPDFVNRLADVLRANPGGLRGPRGPTGAAGAAGIAGAGEHGHWRADEVGFFFPDLHSSYGTSDIVTIGKDSFYRNATVFMDRLDDIVKLKGGDIVRNNVPTCFRGAALQWYTTEVSEDEKIIFRSPSTTNNPQDPIHRWKVALRRRWDPPASVALQNFMTTKYTIPMAVSGASMIQYFSTKLRLAREAGIIGVHQQLLAVWNGLDVDIREHIPEPDEDTTLERFRKSLEERERLWKEKLFRNRVRIPGNAPYGARTGGVSAFGQDVVVRSNERPWVSPAQNQGGPPRFIGGAQNWRNRNEPSGRIAPPPQRLQLTAGTSTGSTGVAPGRTPFVKREPSAWTPGRRACAKCGGQHMDWEHDYYQNPANANRHPPKAFYLDVLRRGMDSYSHDDVADCISAYHAAEETSSPSPPAEDVIDVQAVGGSNWFSDNSSRSYTDYDSEMEYVAQYHYRSKPLTRYQLGEEERVQGDGSGTVLPPRDPSEVSRRQVTWDTPTPDAVDRVATSYLSEITPATEIGPVTTGTIGCPLGEERRSQRVGSRTVLPPRDLSEASRAQVTRDVPIPDYIDGLATWADPMLHPSPETPKATWICRQAECQMSFTTRNKLYRHLKDRAHFVDAVIPTYHVTPGITPTVVVPSRKPHVGTGYAFRGYKYAEVRIRSSPEEEDQWVCVDSGCGMTMADEAWIKSNFPQVHIASMRNAVKVQGIASDSHSTNDYTVIKVVMPAVRDNRTVLVELELEVHLVKGLQCHMLIGVDMLTPYAMSLDFEKCTLNWASERITTEIRVKTNGAPVHRRKIKVQERTIIPPFAYRSVPVKFKQFPHDRDVNFLPSYASAAHLAHAGAFLESVCSNETTSVLYHNKSDRPVILARNTAVGEMTEFDENMECFFVDANQLQDLDQAAFRAAERHPRYFESPTAVTGFHLSAQALMGIGDRIPKNTQELMSDAMSESILDDIGPPDISSSIDDIKYGPDLTVDQLSKLKELVTHHRKIWERTDGVVDEPPENWLKIRLKPGADLKSRGVYRLGRKDRELVDELFDKLTMDGKLTRSRSANPVGWGVFVVRSNKPGDKGRVVVDTRGLNAVTEDDAYPLPRQEDVMAKIRWNLFIALLDQIKSYYQRNVHPESR